MSEKEFLERAISSPIVLSLFDRSTAMVQPWLKAGYECWCVDLQHAKGAQEIEPNLIIIGQDILEWMPPLRAVAITFAFPPCTDLAASGARWFKDKGLHSLVNALALVYRGIKIAEWAGAPYMLENPVSTISTYWRKPDYSFDPCEYAGYLLEKEQEEEAYTKKTCLWTGNGFIMPVPKPVKAVLGSKMHLLPPSEDRANLRSLTPNGFAEAVYKSNAAYVKKRLMSRLKA